MQKQRKYRHLFLGGNSQNRRKLRRWKLRMGLVPTLDELHPIGFRRRLLVEDYGKSYARAKGVVVGYDAGKVLLSVPKRKSPLLVESHQLEAV